MKVTLEEVKNEDKTSKSGKPYTSCGIRVNGQWLNGFGNPITKAWSKGDEVDVEIYEEEYQGKVYKKFRPPQPPRATDIILTAVKALVSEVRELRAEIASLKGSKIPTEEPPVEAYATDLPF